MYDILGNYPELQKIFYSQILQNSLTQELVSNFLFALVAGFGFAYGLNPPKRTLIFSAILAAIGYDIRFSIIHITSFSLAGASFCASFLMGALAIIIAKRLKAPIEVIVFPALLPMFPGSYGYKSIISLLLFIQRDNQDGRLDYLLAFFDNFMVMISVSLSLVAGVLVILAIFYEQSFMMTRGMKRFSFKDH